MRSNTVPALTLLGCAMTAVAYPKRAVLDRAPDADKANAVVEAFRTSWEGYYANAFPNDTLRPLTNVGENDRNAWGVTPIDSLSTAIILGQVEIIDQILDFVPTIDFTTTKEVDSSISLFETNIRYFGGLISAYDLLTGPFKDLVSDEAKVAPLLEQAIVLGDVLSFAFDTPSGIPNPTLFLNPEPAQSDETRNGIAGFGTLVLEWTRLSDLTNNATYAELIQKAQTYLIRPTGVQEAYPGLVGEYLSLETGEFLDNTGGWGAGTDSFYEYLIKMYLYDPVDFEEYKDRWVLAADSTIEHLASHPTTREDLTFLLQFSGTTLTPSSGHLASFAGGNFILGGILLDEPKYIDFGIALTESYYEIYKGAPAGIGSEGFRWVDNVLPEDDTNAPPPADDEEFYEANGFWIPNPYYILRPETIESLYYAYRATGDTKYQDMAWEAFQQIESLCRAGSGYSGLYDVTQADGGGYVDFMESFWLAETLKYSYLIFAEESEVQVKADGSNGWVYNTEAHPVKIRD